jgi:hypothetical protein
MQPSTQVTHMPEAGTTESSVRFLVRVAAEAFTFEMGANIVFSCSSFLVPCLRDRAQQQQSPSWLVTAAFAAECNGFAPGRDRRILRRITETGH